ncbi:hypothetical protein APHAL10511_004990 [Amanita phalloides]|nr:hypothetical protein APHAL10511_004990 [Amanita phalloides]
MDAGAGAFRRKFGSRSRHRGLGSIARSCGPTPNKSHLTSNLISRGILELSNKEVPSNCKVGGPCETATIVLNVVTLDVRHHKGKEISNRLDRFRWSRLGSRCCYNATCRNVFKAFWNCPSSVIINIMHALDTWRTTKLKSTMEGVPSPHDSTNPFDESEPDSEDEIPPLNTVKDLRNGIIKTNQNKTNEYTILLVGETGTGKTTFLSLIANVLAGHSPEEFVAQDQSNEAGGARNQSQTNSAKLYEFASNNGIRFRILDTPGLVDTRGIAQDDLHKASIAQAIKEKISFVNSVLILANGTVERLGAATDYALSALSSMFPRTLADNIGILFTNVSDPLSWNFDQDSLPECLRKNDRNQFLLDNPLAKWKKLTSLSDRRNTSGKRRRLLADLESVVNESHSKALQELALFFDWLDTLTPQPTRDIVELYEQSQEIERNIANALSRASQMGEKKAELARIMQLADGSRLTMEQYMNYKRAIIGQVEAAETVNIICYYPQCHSNCHIFIRKGHSKRSSLQSLLYSVIYALFLGLTGTIWHQRCQICGHSIDDHRRHAFLWEKRNETNVNEEAERRFNETRQQTDEQERVMADLKRHVAWLDQETKEALVRVRQLTESYASLSLIGSFAGQVRMSVRLLEVNLKAMRNKNAEGAIEMVEQSLVIMRRKLELVKEVAKLSTT